MSSKDVKIKLQERQIKKLQNMLHAAQQSSPAPTTPIKYANTPVESIGNHSLSVLDIDGENKFDPARKKVRAITTSTNPFMNLDGVEDTSPMTVGGITVKMELERMWKEEVLAK